MDYIRVRNSLVWLTDTYTHRLEVDVGSDLGSVSHPALFYAMNKH